MKLDFLTLFPLTVPPLLSSLSHNNIQQQRMGYYVVMDSFVCGFVVSLSRVHNRYI